MMHLNHFKLCIKSRNDFGSDSFYKWWPTVFLGLQVAVSLVPKVPCVSAPTAHFGGKNDVGRKEVAERKKGRAYHKCLVPSVILKGLWSLTEESFVMSVIHLRSKPCRI